MNGLLLLPALFTLHSPLSTERLDRIAPAVEAAIKRGDCPGAVVVVVHRDAVAYRQAFGLRSKVPSEAAMTPDTMFDLASVTKPVATATSIMLLIEQGKLRPGDKVSKHWPAFAANGKQDVTVEHCLLHVSGLTADNSIKDYVGTRAEMIDRIAGLSLEAAPGARFRYSDVGFIVLGELVERVGGKRVDVFARENVFDPMKMAGTSYIPSPSDYKLHWNAPIAPTGKRDGKVIDSQVHDPRAFALGGVAGHAGLFGNADDLARYCRMLLNDGELDGVRVLSPLGVRKFTEPHPVPGGLRSYGWDVDTSFTAQRGELFPAGDGFGHTGFTGTSIWVDPPSKTAIILLTNRVHPDDKGNVSELRRQIGTIVASAVASRSGGSGGAGVPPARAAGTAAPPRSAVLTGIDVLRRDQFAALKGRKIGLVTNHTGRAADGIPTIDLIANAPGVELVALFSPEHGIRGEKDEKVSDGKDAQTGRPVFSLYGERRKPTADTLKGIDTLVYDIQDIGCRFYTYISTLGLILEAAKEHGLRVVVLDRPNPIGGTRVEGPVRDAGRGSFVGFHELPLRHGLTVGELAEMFNAERNIGAELTVIPCENWHRGDTWDRTGLPWRNPSPNMRHLTAAILYPGVGLLETTNVSVGRGTERPFEWIGAPWLDGRKLAAAMARKNLPGVRFVPVSRTPVSSVHKDKECGGIDILIDDWQAVRPVRLGLELAAALRTLHPKEWETKRFDTLLIHKATFDGLTGGKTPAALEADWQPGLAGFAERRVKYLRYAE